MRSLAECLLPVMLVGLVPSGCASDTGTNPVDVLDARSGNDGLYDAMLDSVADQGRDFAGDVPVDEKADAFGDVAVDLWIPDSATDGGPDVVGGCAETETRKCYSGPPSTRGIGTCQQGEQSCTDGVWGLCSGDTLPTEEVCDGADNDCDGSTDNLPDLHCGLGQCAVTSPACEAGADQECIPPIGALDEPCNGLDDTCDGQVDEGCLCMDGEKQFCYSGSLATLDIGVCRGGEQTCVGGEWDLCEGEITPLAEICDGVDNDCDWGLDEELGSLSCGMGACAVTIPSCENGSLAVCLPKTEEIEVCDGVDNDCNGQVDDSSPGGGVACNTGELGICAAGTTACIGGTLICNQNVQSSPEVCDGLDNNCSGQADEASPGGGVACNTGKLGICAAGTTACIGGTLICNQNVQSSPEVCDGLDNNCSGQADEGNPGGGNSCQTDLQGVCKAGTHSCVGGSIVCIQNVLPSAETCDGLDNDCDGLLDDDVASNANLFSEAFANNAKGWSLGTEWAIGTATGYTGGIGTDPGLDRTATADNGIAGVVLGGKYSVSSLHSMYYLTSPTINTNVSGYLTLDFWRWLGTDHLPFVSNEVQVSSNGGATWTTIWSHTVSEFIEEKA